MLLPVCASALLFEKEAPKREKERWDRERLGRGPSCTEGHPGEHPNGQSAHVFPSAVTKAFAWAGEGDCLPSPPSVSPRVRALACTPHRTYPAPLTRTHTVEMPLVLPSMGYVQDMPTPLKLQCVPTGRGARQLSKPESGLCSRTGLRTLSRERKKKERKKPGAWSWRKGPFSSSLGEEEGEEERRRRIHAGLK